MSCLVILMAQYILVEGPLIFFNAIPRNMGLFDVASTNACGLTVMKCIQSTKKWFIIMHIQCHFIAHSVWTDQRTFIAH